MSSTQSSLEQIVEQHETKKACFKEERLKLIRQKKERVKRINDDMNKTPKEKQREIKLLSTQFANKRRKANAKFKAHTELDRSLMPFLKLLKKDRLVVYYRLPWFLQLSNPENIKKLQEKLKCVFTSTQRNSIIKYLENVCSGARQGIVRANSVGDADHDSYRCLSNTIHIVNYKDFEPGKIFHMGSWFIEDDLADAPPVEGQTECFPALETGSCSSDDGDDDYTQNIKVSQLPVFVLSKPRV